MTVVAEGVETLVQASGSPSSGSISRRAISTAARRADSAAAAAALKLAASG